VQARLRLARRVRVRVLPQDTEESAHLGQRRPRGVADGEQLAGAVGGHARRGEPGGLGLHCDHRDVVRHDVVELAGDAGPLTASLVLEERSGHGLLRGVARPGLVT
jgi:hypothetical protein